MSREEQNEVLRDTLQFARQMLDQSGGFHPFAVSMKQDGSIVHVGGWNGEEFPKGAELFDVIVQGFKERKDNWKVISICADVRVVSPTTGEMVDAARAAIEDAAGDPVYVFLPYKRDQAGHVDYGTLFACKGDARVFLR
jgi:hypothetical protein